MSSPSRGEQRVCPDSDGHQGIARRLSADPGSALALEAQDAAVAGAGGNGEIQDLAVRHGDAALGAVGGVQELHLHLVVQVGPTPAAPTTAGPASAEEIGKEIRHVGEILVSGGTVIALAPVRLGIVAIESMLGPLRAGGVDFAAVVAGPLLRIVQEVVGGGDLLEALFGRAVAGVEIGVQLLGELAVGLLDVALRSGLFDAENAVGIVRHLTPLFAARRSWGTAR